MIGVIAAIFVAAGLIPAYFELAKRQGRVIGISRFDCPVSDSIIKTDIFRFYLFGDGLGWRFLFTNGFGCPKLVRYSRRCLIYWMVSETHTCFVFSYHRQQPNDVFLSILLETGIFMSHVIWLFRTPRIHKLAKLAGQTYDEYVSSTEKAMSGQTHTGTPSPRAVEPKSSVIQSVDDSPC